MSVENKIKYSDGSFLFTNFHINIQHVNNAPSIQENQIKIAQVRANHDGTPNHDGMMPTPIG